MPRSIAVEGGGDAVSPMDEETNKRKADDYSHASTKHWKQHFMLLEEFHHSRAGKRGHRLGYCKYCFEASQSPTQEQSETIQKQIMAKFRNLPQRCKSTHVSAKDIWQSASGYQEKFGLPGKAGKEKVAQLLQLLPSPWRPQRRRRGFFCDLLLPCQLWIYKTMRCAVVLRVQRYQCFIA